MTSSSEPSSSEPLAAGARVPDFFIVGHHKSGTTALYEMLRRHPQIYMPTLKEPRFFASDLRPFVGVTATGNVPRTLTEYLALFTDAQPWQRAGEASPSYLRSHTAAREIAELQPAARCIAILREPASFVRSLHLQLVQEHVETEKDLRRAVEREQIARGGRTVKRYADHVHYVEQLKRYNEAFPREQLLVLIYDDFRADNEATVRRVLRFLDVDDTVPIETREANPTVSMRSLQFDGMLRSLYGSWGALRPLKWAVKATTTPAARAAAMRRLRGRVAYGAPPPVDEGLMLELRRRYLGEVVALSEYLDRDLVGEWGYGALD